MCGICRFGEGLYLQYMTTKAHRHKSHQRLPKGNFVGNSGRLWLGYLRNSCVLTIPVKQGIRERDKRICHRVIRKKDTQFNMLCTNDKMTFADGKKVTGNLQI